VRLSGFASLLVLLTGQAGASVFVVAICKDGVVAVADSRLTFSDSATGRALAYADGLNKIIRFDSALMAETGQGFLGERRFDAFVRDFADTSGSLAADEILPALLEYGSHKLEAEDLAILEHQHLTVAKFRNGRPLLCGYDGRLGCVEKGYIQSSPTDFAQTAGRLPGMSALEVAAAARASMERYIAAQGKSTTMGGEFSAVLLTPIGTRDLWTLKNPIQARTLDELIGLVKARRIPVTLIPPATWAQLEELFQ
jgi:hypothetical protein